METVRNNLPPEPLPLRDKFRCVFSSNVAHWLIFIVIGVAVYGFTLHYPFVFDDRFLVIGNPLLSDYRSFVALHDIDSFLTTYIKWLAHPDLATSFVLRPVAYLTFYLNIVMYGNNPESFRIVNIAIHILNTIMLYSFLNTIIRRRSDGIGLSSTVTIPFFAALIFLVHPLQTQSVTYIAQRFSSLGTFFYLATMLFYVCSVDEDSTIVRRCVYACSILAFCLGMLTRESVLTVPVALIMVEIIVMRRPLRATLIRLSPLIACMAVVPLRLYYLAAALRKSDLLYGDATDLVGGMYSRFEYAITQVRVILSYLRLFVLPYNQNFDPDYPLFHSLLNLEIIISICVWVVFIGAGVKLLRRKNRTICTDLTGFAIFWFPLSISVSSSFIPLTDLMVEHRTYLPSLAFSTGSAAYLHHLMATGGVIRRKIVVGGLVLVAFVFGVLAAQRNHVYRSRISIWEDTITKNPNKFRPYLELGDAYWSEQRYDDAIRCYKKSLSLNPDYINPLVSLTGLYLSQGNPQETITLCEKYLERYPPDKRIITNLAMAYVELGKFQKAADSIRHILDMKMGDASLLSFYSELNLRLGNISEAQLYLAKAREEDKRDPTIDLSASCNQLEKKIFEAIVNGSIPNPRTAP
jgi:tetratricopeptide (TPR) repeat protein